MERPVQITDIQKLSNLSVEDVKKLLEFYTEEEKEELLEPLLKSNENLRMRIAENEKKIRREQKINMAFLRKMWSGLTEDLKKDGAEFFKSLEDLVNDWNPEGSYDNTCE